LKATGKIEFLEIGRKNTLAVMAPHINYIVLIIDIGLNSIEELNLIQAEAVYSWPNREGKFFLNN
jgi:hypothetical protein